MTPASLSADEREAILLLQLQRLLDEETSEGQVLRLLRRKVLGMSQDRYAQLAGISRRTLSDIERDTGNASIATLNRAFRPLGLKVGLLPRHPSLLAQLKDANEARP